MNSISSFQKIFKIFSSLQIFSQIHSTQDIFKKMKDINSKSDTFAKISWNSYEPLQIEFKLNLSFKSARSQYHQYQVILFCPVTCLAQPPNPRTHIINFWIIPSQVHENETLIYNMQIYELRLSKYCSIHRSCHVHSIPALLPFLIYLYIQKKIVESVKLCTKTYCWKITELRLPIHLKDTPDSQNYVNFHFNRFK